MKKNMALKIRIYPNKNQMILLNKNFGCVRYMYNRLLSLYKEKGKVVSYKEVYNDENDWLLDADTSSYSNVQINLKKAIKSHFSNPKHFGEPQYKSKHNKNQSYTTSVTNNNSRVIDNKHIRIPKVGIIKAIVHKSIPEDYKLKSVTISRECDNKYYASLLYEYELLEENQTNNEFSTITGIDYSQEHLGVLSNGDFLDYPKFMKKDLDYPKFMKKDLDNLKKKQRLLSRCTKGSNNFYKRKNDVARCHIKIRNRRNDFLNKLALSLSKKYDVIVIEDLDLKEISKHHHFGKNIYDNSYGMFINKLTYKLEQLGKRIIKVDKYFPSSKKCYCCSNIHNLTLETRVYDCECGNHIDRDINSALNLAIEGIRILEEQTI